MMKYFIGQYLWRIRHRCLYGKLINTEKEELAIGIYYVLNVGSRSAFDEAEFKSFRA